MRARQDVEAPGGRGPLSWRRLLGFLFLFAALYEGLAQSWELGLGHWIIDDATVAPAAWLARLASGDAAIVADGSHLRSPAASINILYGCEGSDVFMLLCAALLVTPVPWRNRWAGVLAGAACVFLLNQMRVLALFYCLRTHNGWFGSVHGLVAPLALVILIVAFYLAWLRWAQRGSGDGALA
jgi:exosortase/archaeosortase family protein